MHTRHLHLLAGASLLAVIGLAGCNRETPGPTAGQRVDGAIEKTQDKLDDVKSSAANAAQATARALNDTTITAGVKAKLGADPELRTLDISVETQNGRTSLIGSAPNAAARERAQLLAVAVTGVSSVDNQLTLKP